MTILGAIAFLAAGAFIGIFLSAIIMAGKIDALDATRQHRDSFVESLDKKPEGE